VNTLALFIALFCLAAIAFGASLFIRDQFTPPEE
jgi:hypothetical protein